MKLNDVAIDYSSLVRARGRFVDELQLKYDGYNGSSSFKEEVDALHTSLNSLLYANRGLPTQGIWEKSCVYDQLEAIVVYTPRHKIVLVQLGGTGGRYAVVSIYLR